MGKIKDIVEQRIKGAARIDDILEDGLGVQLYRDGANLQGLCPFHEDRHLGSFKVSESKNICTCFSCGKTWNPIDALMEGKGMKYADALRWIAAKYGIYVDDEPVPEVKRAEIRPKAPELPIACWSLEVVKNSLHHDDIDPLLTYLNALPMTAEDRARFKFMREVYLVGTSTKGRTMGWTIWWQIDDKQRVRTAKLMAYKADGHRNKAINATWMHTLMESVGRYNRAVNSIETCLFGLHLVDAFPKAEVCIVESEKSALICSAFTEPTERLWMATGGKSGLNRKKLQPLIDRKRYIVVYPDKDGYQEWRAMAEMIGYNRLSVSNKVNDLWIAADGEKADIADIMLRQLSGIKETEGERTARQLGCPERAEQLQKVIDILKLERD